MDIRVEDVGKSYDGKAVLEAVSLRVGEGENVGIIGPNGSGKSTLLKCIYRVIKPDHGVVYLGGDALSAISVRESAKREAVLAQHHASDFDLRVLDIVLMGRSPYKRMLDRYDARDVCVAEESLRFVGMEGFRDHSFSLLSGGEQQRVMLARAFAQETPCLVLDEPTNHLDIRYQIQIMERVKAMGKTVVAAIHDLNIAALYCDRLIAMKAGRILCEGTREEVLTEDFIHELYEVRAHVLHLDDGSMVIAFRP